MNNQINNQINHQMNNQMNISWLTVIPIKELSLKKGEFRDAIKLQDEWEIIDLPSVCICGKGFNVDHVMICPRGGFMI